jgi:hypothetical protein
MYKTMKLINEEGGRLQIAPQSPSSIIRGLYNRPEVAAVPSGLSPTPLIINNNNNNTLSYIRL